MVERIKGKKVIGIKQGTKAIKQDQGNVLYVAKDAEEKLVQPIIKLAEEKSLETVFVNTMKELGRLCGIDVGAATVVTLKDN